MLFRTHAAVAAPPRWFAVADLRSLAAFRMLIGVYMLLDLKMRWNEIDIWYTDEGLCTREYMLENHWHKGMHAG